MATGLPSKYDVIAKSVRRSRFISGKKDHSISQRHTKASFVSMLQADRLETSKKEEVDRSKKLSPRF